MRRSGTTRLLVAAVAAAALVPLLLTGCGREQPASLLVGSETIAVADREAMPPISGPTSDGTSLDLADLRGKVVVLNSWASWCAPCREEIPAFVRLADSVDPNAVRVVGLNVSDETSAADAFATSLGMDYPSIIDARGALLRTVPGVPPSALPSTVVIDRAGNVAARIIGVADPAQLSEIVTAVTMESAPG